MVFETAVVSHGNIVRSSIASARLLHIVVFVVAVTARVPSIRLPREIDTGSTGMILPLGNISFLLL
jgi:hypothetical protein